MKQKNQKLLAYGLCVIFACTGIAMVGWGWGTWSRAAETSPTFWFRDARSASFANINHNDKILTIYDENEFGLFAFHSIMINDYTRGAVANWPIHFDLFGEESWVYENFGTQTSFAGLYVAWVRGTFGFSAWVTRNYTDWIAENPGNAWGFTTIQCFRNYFNANVYPQARQDFQAHIEYWTDFEFIDFNDGWTIRLGGDLNLNDHLWVPLKINQTIFDGQGHTINGLRISISILGANWLWENSGAGLFAHVDYSIIKNVNITNVALSEMHGSGLLGAVVGRMQSSELVNVNVANVDFGNANADKIGGLVGQLNSGKIIDSSLNGFNFQAEGNNHVESPKFIITVGGIVGEINNGTVRNVQATSLFVEVRSSYSCCCNSNWSATIGGIAAEIHNSEIFNNLAKAKIYLVDCINKHPSSVGGIFGFSNNSIVTNNLYIGYSQGDTGLADIGRVHHCRWCCYYYFGWYCCCGHPLYNYVETVVGEINKDGLGGVISTDCTITNNVAIETVTPTLTGQLESWVTVQNQTTPGMFKSWFICEETDTPYLAWSYGESPTLPGDNGNQPEDEELNNTANLTVIIIGSLLIVLVFAFIGFVSVRQMQKRQTKQVDQTA